MRSTTDDRVTILAERQHGVVTRTQLIAAGLTRRVVQARIRSGRLRPLHRGVYLLGSLRGPLEPEHAREMAAVLACGAEAVVSHRSAGWVWKLLPRPQRGMAVEITVPAHRQSRRPGIRVHRCRGLSQSETTELEGLPVTTAARTLRDLSIVLGTRELSRAIARAERRGLIGTDDIPALAARHKGMPGAPLLRAAIQADGGPVLTRSSAEERFLLLIRNGRLPAPRTNVLVRGHEVDFFWAAERLVVEVDGFDFHASRRSFENDRRRDAELAAAGIHVIRVTWRQIVDEAAATLVRVAQALSRKTRT